MRSSASKTEQRPPLDVLETPPDRGLSEDQVRERRRLGYVNTPVDGPGKTVGQIVLSNVCTWFNLIFVILAVLVAAVGSWNNLMFMGVVVCNTVIGIVQEVRSKRVLDKLNLLSAQRCAVIRGGEERQELSEALVRDDVVIFRAGEQICADALVLTGECRVNEALLTGEADEVRKTPGDRLLSGSFVVSGSCRARLTAVGADSYASRLTLEAKRDGKSRESEMMRSLSLLVKWIGVILLPLGAALLWKELVWRHADLAEGMVSTVGALIGMIPEGLYLLTSLALVASVLRLAQRKTLVHELKSIETLARVDTLCVDKTGTITEPDMAVEELIPLGGAAEAALAGLLADYAAAVGGENDTMLALAERFRTGTDRRARRVLPFTSAKKYGSVDFETGETVCLGAPEVLLGDRAPELGETLEALAGRGCRVLLLAAADAPLREDAAPDPAALTPLALVALSNPIRPAAAETFRYFAEQGVAVKVISGDNPLTVSQVALRAGVAGAERYVDARTLPAEGEALAAALEEYTVFGRVTPEQKRAFVRSLKASSHTVAMTGDGVNDVLALKDADCSVAMASGSDAASRVSDLVLLENDFSVLPGVVAEGRRVINNIERSATLFLLKNICSMLLSLTGLLFRLPFPFAPVQLTLVSMLTIGFPSFVLAMEPNEQRVQGRFLSNVLYRAVPPGVTDFLLILGTILVSRPLGLSRALMSTVCVYAMSFVGLVVILRLCRPFTTLRKLMVAAILLGFAVAIFFLPGWFQLAPLDGTSLLVLAGAALLAIPLLVGLTRLWEKLANY